MKTINELEETGNRYNQNMIYYYMALKDVIKLIDEMEGNISTMINAEELKARITG